MDNEKVTYFAETDHRNKKTKFGIKAKDRTRHVYVIGKTGMGKSTLLENMAVQDIQNGNGLAFIDPHGATAEKLLEYIPEDRIDDVLYFAPFDIENPISFNVMEDVGEDKRHLVLDGLMSAFKKIWVDAWSSRMEYILGNTILALLEYPDSTMLGINRMYTDKEYQKKVVDYIQDPSVKAFWTQEFAKYTDRYAQEATPAIQNKVGQFTSNPLIRNIIGQEKSSFDIREIMDKKKILIINLSKGRVGEQNANLLGSMLITKIYLAAMSRADQSAEKLESLPNFYLYVDEFQSFANESFANILSEARKYKLNLTIAHQYIEQMSEEVRAAVFGNVGTMMSFRVGSYDAEVLEKEFAPQFISEDMVNLGFAQIYLKLMVDGISSQPFSATTLPPIETPRVSYKDVAIARSRKNFSSPRKEVEAKVNAAQLDSENSVARAVEQKKRAPYRNNFADLRQTEDRRQNPNRRENPSQNLARVTDTKEPFGQTQKPERKTEQRSEQVEKHKSDQVRTQKPEPTKPPKVGGEEHLQSLRQVLEKAMQEKSEQKSAGQNPVPPPLPKPGTKPVSRTGKNSAEGQEESNQKKPDLETKERASEPESTKAESEQSGLPREIPESELKKLLHVERDQ